MSQNPDLFPETLLVSREGERIYTTSLKVAEYFKKRHTHVLRAVEGIRSHHPNLDCQAEPNFGLTEEFGRPNFGPSSDINGLNFELVEEFGRLNFQESSYLNAQKKTQPMYEMTHDGFALLAMGFTGKEALIWKIKFLNAFREMERQLAERKDQIEGAFRRVRPWVLPVLEGTEQGLSRSAIAAPLGKSPASVTYHRRQAKLFGFLH